MPALQVLMLVSGALCALVMVAAGIGKVTGQPAMRASADHFSIPWDRYRLIGFAEIAGALGIVLGIWSKGVGLAAGLGAVALLAGAVMFHVRFRDAIKVAAPALVALAVAATYVTVQAAGIWA
jgi:hypothetical protein